MRKEGAVKECGEGLLDVSSSCVAIKASGTEVNSPERATLIHYVYILLYIYATETYKNPLRYAVQRMQEYACYTELRSKTQALTFLQNPLYLQVREGFDVVSRLKLRKTRVTTCMGLINLSAKSPYSPSRFWESLWTMTFGAPKLGVPCRGSNNKD